MKRLAITLLALFIVPVAFADTLSFAVIGIDCPLCAPPVTKALQSVDGVSNVKVNTNTKTATVDVPSGFDKQKIRTALSNAGFAPVFAGEQAKEIQTLPADVVKTLDIVAYDDGHRVDVAKIVAPRKITVVDFYADWCGPCHVLEARLQHFMEGRKNLAVRRVNIGKWDNEAAKQATREFHAEALPYIRVYDANGKFVKAVTGGMWDEVLAAIAKAEK